MVDYQNIIHNGLDSQKARGQYTRSVGVCQQVSLLSGIILPYVVWETLQYTPVYTMDHTIIQNHRNVLLNVESTSVGWRRASAMSSANSHCYHIDTSGNELEALLRITEWLALF